MDEARRRRTRGTRRFAGAAALSALGHGSLLLALILGRPAPPPRAPVAAPMTVTLVSLAPPVVAPPAQTPEPAQARTPEPTPQPKEASPRSRVRRTPAPPAADPLPAAPALSEPATAMGAGQAELTGADLAGATSADAGGSGGACDMARRLQSALRKDPLVQAAVGRVSASAGGAILVWNGDWIRNENEDGKGLAAVREAVMWEIAFAPPACRSQPMRGFILLSMTGAPGAARLAIGHGAWRWSDLLK